MEQRTAGEAATRRLAQAVGIGALLSLPGLSGCAEPPWTMALSPHEMRLRWYPGSTSAADADQIAQLHCSRSGRRAVLAETGQHGSAQTGTWCCE